MTDREFIQLFSKILEIRYTNQGFNLPEIDNILVSRNLYTEMGKRISGHTFADLYWEPKSGFFLDGTPITQTNHLHGLDFRLVSYHEFRYLSDGKTISYADPTFIRSR